MFGIFRCPHLKGSVTEELFQYKRPQPSYQFKNSHDIDKIYENPYNCKDGLYIETAPIEFFSNDVIHLGHDSAREFHMK